MPQISSADTAAMSGLEAARLWGLLRDIRVIRENPGQTDESVEEIRDEFDLLAVMSDCPAIVRRARRAIADIDRDWPHVAVA